MLLGHARVSDASLNHDLQALSAPYGHPPGGRRGSTIPAAVP